MEAKSSHSCVVTRSSQSYRGWALAKKALAEAPPSSVRILVGFQMSWLGSVQMLTGLEAIENGSFWGKIDKGNESVGPFVADLRKYVYLLSMGIVFVFVVFVGVVGVVPLLLFSSLHISLSLFFLLLPPIGMANPGSTRSPLIRNPVEGLVYCFNPKFREMWRALDEDHDHWFVSKRPSSKDLRTFDEIPSAPTHKSATIKFSSIVLSLVSSVSLFPLVLVVPVVTTIFTIPSSVGSMYSQRTPRRNSIMALLLLLLLPSSSSSS